MLPNENPQQGTTGIISRNSMDSSNNNHSNNGVPPYHHQGGAPLKLPPAQRDSRKLFVGGLPSNVTEEEFLEFFQQYGSVLDSRVMIDRDTRRSRGFGFITFEDEAVARQLLSARVPDMEHQEGVGRVYMQGKLCEIKAAQPKGDSGFQRYNHNFQRYNNYFNNNKRGRKYGNHSTSNHFPFHQEEQHMLTSNAVAGAPSSVNSGVPSTLPVSYETNPTGAPMMYTPNMYHYPAHNATPIMYGGSRYAATGAPYPAAYYETDQVTTDYGGGMSNDVVHQGYGFAPVAQPMAAGGMLPPPTSSFGETGVAVPSRDPMGANEQFEQDQGE